MDVNNICRCCLTNEYQLLTIYEGGTTDEDCLAAMINKVTGIKVVPDDKLPDKVCLLCIRYIKDFYAFKQKCETSHRTLLQLFLCRVEVRLKRPLKNIHSQEATRKEDLIAPVSTAKHTKTTVDDVDYNVELSNPSSAENGISITSSTKYFQKANLPTETTTHLEYSKHIPQSTTEITEKIYSDSERDSCESIEFISDKPNRNEEFGEMYNTNHNADVNVTPVEYGVFKNVASPQWVHEEDIYLSIVNEDLNYDDVERQTKCNSRMEDSSNYPNDVEISAGSPYHCDICKQGFKLRNDLISHLETHENSYDTNSHKPSTNPKKLKVKRASPKHVTCDVCLKSFIGSSSLNRHRRIHTGEKPFKCRYCEKSFVQKNTCFYHEKTHTGEKQFQCKFCDKKFIQRGTLRAHEILHTGEKPFKCKYCDKTFVQCGSRTSHEKLHTGERPYKCQYCENAFIRLRCKIKHEKLHKL